MTIISRKDAKEKGLTFYFTGKPCLNGHIANRLTSTTQCRVCKQEWEEKKKQPIKHFYRPNLKLNCYTCKKEIILGGRKSGSGVLHCPISDSYAEKIYCSESCKRRQRTLTGKNAAIKRRRYKEDESFRETKKELERIRRLKPEVKKRQRVLSKEWKENNLERHRKNRREWRKDKMQNDLHFKIKMLLSHRVQAAVKNKSVRTKDLIGCDIDHFEKHIEKQFDAKMSWNSWSPEGWHLDHVRPCQAFDLTEEAQQKVCFNWRNYQPMWGEENMSKNDKYTPLDEVAWVERMLSLGYEGELFLKYEEGNSY